jgi:lysophospholipid acyltransferase (LPLAT)-like uncharacterized protein
VPADPKDVYRFAPLTGYSARQRFLIYLADLAFYSLIKLIGWTLRFEVDGWENFENIEQSGHVPIYCFWHDRIFAGTYYFRNRGIVVMTSQSQDGEYIARFIKRFGYGSIRGSSTRGGAGALVEMVRHIRHGLPMAFTVDGPRGPRHVAKSGPVLLAKKTGHPMMPFVVECRKYWTVKSWDRLQIPHPFSRAKVIIAKPIYVDGESTAEQQDDKRLELQLSLDRLVEQGQKWRDGVN